MEKIKGLILPKLNFKPQKVGDLLYHDGPLLSHFYDLKRPNDNYFYRWVDSDETFNRWLIFRVQRDDLHEFFVGEITLRKLIEFNQSVILLDLNDNLKRKNILLTTVDNLPETYLPSNESYFDEEFYEEYALKLRESVRRSSSRQVAG